MSREEFEQMRARHRTEIERALVELRRKRSEMERKLAELHAEMAAAQIKFERALTQGAQFEAARAYRDKFGSWPEILRQKKRRRRPPRGSGGEPAPVFPKPKPTPLMDGAEAPIE